MKFSYKTLSKFVDLSSCDVDSLVHRLTFAGFEVEGVSSLAYADKLVIGHVLTCENHPDSDHLHVLSVDCGNYGILDIVCGAKNVRKGLKVIVALVGCHLPAIDETIKKGVIRGKESNGMCCSLLELGVNKEALNENSPSLDGIEELPEDAPVGSEDVLSYLELDDTILDINVLPNRPDCLSYIGMAREISSLTGFALNEIPTFKNEYSSTIEVSSKTSACSRFDGLYLKDVLCQDETPLEVQRLLLANDIRSISPIVDLGNYVMLLTGQPFNMYDAKKNTTGKYIAVDDYQGEFSCFDSKKVDVINGDILITDGDSKPLCLAGIMTSLDASISSSTKDIFVEVADFYHANIRHTCNRLGLSSASSQLFSKGRNPNMIDEAIAVLIASLPMFLKSYTIASYSSYNQVSKKNKPFMFSYDALNKRLGSSYTHEEIDAVLKAFRVTKLDDGTLLAPVDRVDLNEQCDIDEEVFRYYPADKIKPSFEHFPLTHGQLTPSQKMKREIRSLLVNKGYDEILSFTLISEKEDKSIRVFSHDEAYKIINPMTKDHEIVRVDLLPTMISTLQYNISHQNENLALFEISDIDTPKGNHIYLSLGLAGKTSLCEAYQQREYSFFDLKGSIEAIFNKIGLSNTRYRLDYSKNECFHPKASCDIFIGKDKIGTFGQLHPSFVKNRLLVGEIDLGYLMNLKGLKTKFTTFSSHPMVKRDLSFKMNDKVSFAELKKKILSCKNCYVKKVEYFDDFVDKLTSERYLGVSLTLGKDDGTLNENEINSALNEIKSTIKASFGLTIRGE